MDAFAVAVGWFSRATQLKISAEDKEVVLKKTTPETNP
jgi:hypothetical protein